MSRKSLAKLERIRLRQRDRASAYYRQFCVLHEQVMQDYGDAVAAVSNIAVGQANGADELERLGEVIEHCRFQLDRSRQQQQELLDQLNQAQICLRRSEILHERAGIEEKKQFERRDQQQCDESSQKHGQKK